MIGRTPRPSNRDELIVLAFIAFGLLAILFSIIAGLFGWFESKAQQPLPNWAENVLVSIATATALKLGDVLSVLLALATGRQVGKQAEALGVALAGSVPLDPPAPVPAIPADAAAAAAAGAERATAAAGAVADDLANEADPAEPGTDERNAP